MTRSILFSAIFLLPVLCLVQSKGIIFYEDLDNDVRGIDKIGGHVICRCNDYEDREKPLDEGTAGIFFSDVLYFQNFSKTIEQHPDIKEFVEGCLWCQVSFTDCYGNSSYHTCIKRTVKFVLDANYRQDKDLLSISHTTTSYGMKNVNVSTSLLTTLPRELLNEGKFADDRNEMQHHVQYGVLRSMMQSNAVESKTNGIQTAEDHREVLKILTALGSKINGTQTAEDHPQVITIPMRGSKNRQRRKRALDTCALPDYLQTADVKCLKYPSKATCVQRCALGYTLPTGIRRNVECRFEDNKWKPSPLQECQPYVDCTVTLTSGGSLSCKAADLVRGTECRIECLHFEDQPHVPETVYTCSIDGTWDPPLPFCAMKGTAIALVKPPKVKFHEDIDSRPSS